MYVPLTLYKHIAQAGSSDWLTPVADGLQTVLVFIQSGLEQAREGLLSSQLQMLPYHADRRQNNCTVVLHEGS